MRTLILPLFLVALAASAVFATPHVVNEFSIPIPSEAATPSVQYLSGAVFTIMTDSGITAVDLTSKAVIWNYKSSSIADFYVTGSNVLVVGTSYAEALHLTNGSSIWKNTTATTVDSADEISFSTIETGNTIVETDNQLWSVNAATGSFAYTMELTGSPISSGTHLYYTNQASQLVAVDLATGDQAWMISAPTQGSTFNPVLYADSNYVVSSIATVSGDTVLFVGYASNGHQKLRLEGMSGLNSDSGAVTIVGSNLTVVAGENYNTYVIDINTGYIIGETSGNSGGGGGGSGNGGTYSLSLANGDVLKVHSTAASTTYGEGFSIQKSTAGGAFTTVCPNTPSSGNFNMAYLGDGLLKVGNLQGWVLFYIEGTTCVTIARNEKIANYKTATTTGSVLKFDGTFIEVEGKDIIGFKVVQ